MGRLNGQPMFYSVLLLAELVFCNVLQQLAENGVEFGDVTSLDNVSIDANIFDMQYDLYLSVPHVLVSDRYRLRTINLATSEISDIAGAGSDVGYKEGQLADALFNEIRSLVQRCIGTVLVVDTNNHCVRTIDRNTSSTSVLAGLCTQAGYKDGNLSTSMFNHPTEISMGTSPDVYYIVDAQHLRVLDLRLNNVNTLDTDGPPSRLFVGYGYLYFAVNDSFVKLNATSGLLENLPEVRSTGDFTNQTCDILVFPGDQIVRSEDLETLNFSQACASENKSEGLADMESCQIDRPCQMLLRDDMTLLVNTQEGLRQISLAGMNFSTFVHPSTSCPLIQLTTSAVTSTTSTSSANLTQSTIRTTAIMTTQIKRAASPRTKILNTTITMTTHSRDLHRWTTTTTRTSSTIVNDTSVITTELYKKKLIWELFLNLDLKWQVMIGVGLLLLLVLMIILIACRRRICTCCRKERRKVPEDSIRELYALGNHEGQPLDAYDSLLDDNSGREDVGNADLYTRGPMDEIPVTFKSTQSPPQSIPQKPLTTGDNSYFICITNDESAATSALLNESTDA